MTFVHENKDRSEGGQRWGVESICAVLTEHGTRIAPSTYYDAMARPPSARAVRDAQLRPHIRRTFDDSGATFGPRRVWRVLNDGGITVARCTVERLMGEMELRSALGRPGSSRPRPPWPDRPQTGAPMPSEASSRRR